MAFHSTAVFLVAFAVAVITVDAQIVSESANEMRVIFPHPSIAIRLIQCLGTNLNAQFSDLLGMVPLENGWTNESAGAFEASLVSSIVDQMRVDSSIDSYVVSQVVSGCLERVAGVNGRTYGDRLNLLLRRSMDGKNILSSSSAAAASNSGRSRSSARAASLASSQVAEKVEPFQPTRQRFQRNRKIGSRGEEASSAIASSGNLDGSRVDSDQEMAIGSINSADKSLFDSKELYSKGSSKTREETNIENSVASSALVSSIADNASLDSSSKLKGSETKTVENSNSELSDLFDLMSSKSEAIAMNPSDSVTSSSGVSKAASSSKSSAIQRSIFESDSKTTLTSTNSLTDSKTDSSSKILDTLNSSKQVKPLSKDMSDSTRSKNIFHDMFKMKREDNKETASTSLETSINNEKSASQSKSSAASSSNSLGTKSVSPSASASSSSSTGTSTTGSTSETSSISSGSSKLVLEKETDGKSEMLSSSSNDVEILKTKVPLKKDSNKDDLSEGFESELKQMERLLRNEMNVVPLSSDPKTTFISLLEEAMTTSTVLKSSLTRLDSQLLNDSDLYSLVFNAAQWAGVLNAREVAERLSRKNDEAGVLSLTSYLRGSAVAVAEMLVSRNILTQENVKSLSRLYVNRIELALQMEEIEAQREFFQVLADVNQQYLLSLGVLESEMIEFSQYFGREILIASVSTEGDSSIKKLSDVLRSSSQSAASSAASASETSQSSTASATSSADASSSASSKEAENSKSSTSEAASASNSVSESVSESSSSSVSTSSESSSKSNSQTSISTASAMSETVSNSDTDENKSVTSFINAFLKIFKSSSLLKKLFDKIATVPEFAVGDTVFRVIFEVGEEAGLPESASLSTAKAVSDALKVFNTISSSEFQTVLSKSVGRFLNDLGLLSVNTSEYLAAAFVKTLEAEAKNSTLKNAALFTRGISIGIVKFLKSLDISTDEISSNYTSYVVEELRNLKSGKTKDEYDIDDMDCIPCIPTVDITSVTKSDDMTNIIKLFSSEMASSVIKVYSSLESFKEISETKISNNLARRTLLKAFESSSETLKFLNVESVMKIITTSFKGSSQKISLPSFVNILGNALGHVLYDSELLTSENYKELSQAYIDCVSKRIGVLKSTGISSYLYPLMHGAIDFLHNQKISDEESLMRVASEFNSRYQSFQTVSVAEIETSEQSASNVTIQQTSTSQEDSKSTSSSTTSIESFKSTFKASLLETMSSSESLAQTIRSATALSTLSEAFRASLTNHSKLLNLTDPDSISEITSAAFENFPDSVPYMTLVQSCVSSLAQHLSQKELLTPKNADRLSEAYVSAFAEDETAVAWSLFETTFGILETFGIGGLSDLRHLASLFNSHFHSESSLDPEVLSTSSDFVQLLLAASPDILSSRVLFSDDASTRVSAMSSFVTSALALAEEGGMDAVTFLRALLSLVSRVTKNSPDLPFGQALIESLLESNLALVRVVNSSGVRSVNFSKSSEVTTVLMKALRNWIRD